MNSHWPQCFACAMGYVNQSYQNQDPDHCKYIHGTTHSVREAKVLKQGAHNYFGWGYKATAFKLQGKRYPSNLHDKIHMSSLTSYQASLSPGNQLSLSLPQREL